MKQLKTNKTWTQYIPNIIPINQSMYWHTTGIHYEEQYGENHLDIEKFTFKSDLVNLLQRVWKHEISTGEIKMVHIASYNSRYRFTFTKYKPMNNPTIDNAIRTVIEQTYDVTYWIDVCLRMNQMVPTKAPKIPNVTNIPKVTMTSNTAPYNKITITDPDILNYINYYKDLKTAQEANFNLMNNKVKFNNIVRYRFDNKNNHIAKPVYSLFKDKVYRYCENNNSMYPQKSLNRKWFTAYQYNKWLNANGNYVIPNSSPTAKAQQLVSHITSNLNNPNSCMAIIKNHYGAKFNSNIYSREMSYYRKHNKKFTWQDPNYSNYLKNIQQRLDIEKANKPVRLYMQYNMKNEWETYNYERKLHFAGKNPTSLDYAKYCSDYILRLINQNKLPVSATINWKHWSKI